MFFYVNDEPESKFLNTETIKLYCIVLSHRLTNVLQIQQDVVHQISAIESRLSSFRDFPERCRKFGKPHGLPFLVELSCFIVHVHLPVRGTPCRPTSPQCSGTVREASVEVDLYDQCELEQGRGLGEKRDAMELP